MSTDTMTPNEITRRAVRILLRELGPAQTWSFLSQVSHGHGDYTAEHQLQPDSLTVDEIIQKIRAAKNARTHQ